MPTKNEIINRYICIYICVYVYICITIHDCVNISIHEGIVCVYIYIYTHTCAYIYIYIMVHVHVCVYANTYTRRDHDAAFRNFVYDNSSTVRQHRPSCGL